MDPMMQELQASGFSRTAAILAASYVAKTREGRERAVEFCNNYNQLTAMGFAPAMAVGALVKHKNDVNASTDTCLGA